MIPEVADEVRLGAVGWPVPRKMRNKRNIRYIVVFVDCFLAPIRHRKRNKWNIRHIVRNTIPLTLLVCAACSVCSACGGGQGGDVPAPSVKAVLALVASKRRAADPHLSGLDAVLSESSSK